MAPRREKVRLTCVCGHDEDGTITIAEARILGWEEITEERSYEDSIDTNKGEALDWFTHLGTCPDCVKEWNEAKVTA